MEKNEKPAAPPKKRRWKLILWSILILPIVVFVLYTVFTLNWSYAKGERAGYVQKFSRQGWLVKTWEGELAMVNLPGTAPEKFLFSVRDDAVAGRINQALGKRVALLYEEHRGVPSRIFGETDFYVVDVRVLE
jgi:hypothetical protein